ncbi:MAG TPA: hypothetical protein VEC96_16765, partial [Anaerolineae bacterium]|nr:hypothetical protein [Anaerolineae bacterium]
MKAKRTLGIAFILAGMSLIAWVGAAGWKNSPIEPRQGPSTPTPLWQAEPIVPTAFLPSVSQETRLPQAEALLPSLSTAPANALERFGVGVPNPPLEGEVVERLGLGWYLAWKTFEQPHQPAGIEFWQMIRVHEEGFRPDEATLQKVAQANPGATWLIGNEPDVVWQDNVSPARYAERYHELYYLLKEADPTCQVAIGGVAQPTPLRLQYLEMVLAFYQTRYGEVMPVDIWNIHNFILREERENWGVDIPPGLTVKQGILYELDDHDNLEIFKAQIINFRQWLADRGQRDKPLIISEYGILMPADYGFGFERVQRFLFETYTFMLTATD